MSGRSFIRAELALVALLAAGCTRAQARPLTGPLRVAAAADLALAFKQVVEAGRHGYLAGRMPIRAHASPSSPTAGVVRMPDPEVPA